MLVGRQCTDGEGCLCGTKGACKYPIQEPFHLYRKIEFKHHFEEFWV